MKLSLSIDYSLHLLCVSSAFSPFFYCELLPLLCGIFPIHTLSVSMSHLKRSLQRSGPKVLLQTDFLFMVFSSINGPLSPDTMAFTVGCIFYSISNGNSNINIMALGQLFSEIVLSRFGLGASATSCFVFIEAQRKIL